MLVSAVIAIRLSLLGGSLAALDAQAAFGEAVLEQADAVVAPERLAAEDEHRDAEDAVRRGLLLRARVVLGARAGQVGAVVGIRHAEHGDEPRDRVRIVGLELALEEGRERRAAVLDQ